MCTWITEDSPAGIGIPPCSQPKLVKGIMIAGRSTVGERPSPTALRSASVLPAVVL